MKLTNEQLTDILNANNTMWQKSLEFGRDTVHFQLRQQYAVARLTLALLSRVDLPNDHEKVVWMLEQYCVLDTITHMEFTIYLRDLNLKLEAADQDTFVLWTPADIAQITAHTIDAYRRAGLPLPDGYAEALEQWGYIPPAERYDPLRLTLQDCLPEPTLCPERLQTDTELYKALEQVDPAQSCALILLLLINGRDRHCNVSVLRVLGMINTYLQSAPSREALKANDRTTKAIERNFGAVLRELDLRVHQLPKPKIDPLAQWKDILFHDVLVSRADSDGVVRSTIFQMEDAMWHMIHNLEVEIEQADTIGTDLHVQHTLLMLSSLWLNEISPGSGISTLQRLAARNLGVDPLWHWKEINRTRWNCYDFEAPFAFPFLVVALAKVVDSPLPVHDADMRREARDLAGKLAVHLLACLRRMGIMLPEHGLMQDYLESFGESRTLPLPETVAADLEVRTCQLLAMADYATSQFHHEKQKAAQMMVDSAETELGNNAVAGYVAEARRLMTGKRVALIGDAPDPARRKRLIAWFGLASLDWITSEEYAHSTRAQHRIAGNAEVVLLAARWMGHAHSTLTGLARDLDIPCVYLPGGLNEHMVSMQITRQMRGRPAERRSMKA
ncbi:hypothetical protein ACFOPQ_10410 [Deinococcus antarcticus]|uniref:Uncharacterized protein n=1 Tax=Deinococcus antarcticus TaxID=1298767 RepID=A0ABV8A7G5_9DEIO